MSVVNYDQAHYVWAKEQLSQYEGWGINASSNLSGEFLETAMQLCSKYNAEDSRKTGEVMVYSERWNCFVLIGTSFCASLENNRTNHICHLLAPVCRNQQMQSTDELFFPFTYVKGISPEKHLPKLERAVSIFDYQEVLEKFHLTGDRSGRERLAQLLCLFFQVTVEKKQNVEINLGPAFQEDYLETVHAVMWLFHSWAAEIPEKRKLLSSSIYATGFSGGFCFGKNLKAGSFVLDDFHGEAAGRNVLETALFMELAEKAQTSLEAVQQAVQEVIACYQRLQMNDLAYTYLTILLENPSFKISQEIADYICQRASAPNYVGEAYRKQYFKLLERKELNYKEALYVWNLLVKERGGRGFTAEENRELIIKIFQSMKKAKQFENVRKMIQALEKYPKTLLAILEKDMEKPVEEWLITWHITSISIVREEKRKAYIKALFKTYQCILKKCLDNQMFNKCLLEEFKGLYIAGETKDRTTITEIVMELYAEKPDMRQMWKSKYAGFFWKQKPLQERLLDENPDKYISIDICLEAQRQMIQIYGNWKEPDPWLNMDRIQELYNQSVYGEEQKQAFEKNSEDLKSIKQQKKIHDVNEQIGKLMSVKELLDIQKSLSFSENWSVWLDRLQFVIDAELRIEYDELKQCVSNCTKIIQKFKEQSEKAQNSALKLEAQQMISKAENFIESLQQKFSPDSECFHGARLNGIGAYAWFCSYTAGDNQERQKKLAQDFWRQIRVPDDFEGMISRFSNEKSITDENKAFAEILNIRVLESIFYRFYQCFYQGDFVNSEIPDEIIQVCIQNPLESKECEHFLTALYNKNADLFWKKEYPVHSGSDSYANFLILHRVAEEIREIFCEENETDFYNRICDIEYKNVYNKALNKLHGTKNKRLELMQKRIYVYHKLDEKTINDNVVLEASELIREKDMVVGELQERLQEMIEELKKKKTESWRRKVDREKEKQEAQKRLICKIEELKNSVKNEEQLIEKLGKELEEIELKIKASQERQQKANQELDQLEKQEKNFLKKYEEEGQQYSREFMQHEQEIRLLECIGAGKSEEELKKMMSERKNYQEVYPEPEKVLKQVGILSKETPEDSTKTEELPEVVKDKIEDAGKAAEKWVQPVYTEVSEITVNIKASGFSKKDEQMQIDDCTKDLFDDSFE